jgi:hypothetical protein
MTAQHVVAIQWDTDRLETPSDAELSLLESVLADLTRVMQTVSEEDDD